MTKTFTFFFDTHRSCVCVCVCLGQIVWERDNKYHVKMPEAIPTMKLEKTTLGDYFKRACWKK